MVNKPKTTLLLAVILFALLSWAVYLGKRQPARPSASQESRLLPAGSPENVVRLTFSSPGREILLKRSGSSWQLMSPEIHPADPFTVEQFLRQSFMLHYIRRLCSGPSNLSGFGLEPCSAMAVYGYANNTADTLYLGGNTPKGSWYARKGEDTCVYTLSTEFGNGLLAPASHWRMHRIAEFSPYDVGRVVVKGKLGQQEFWRDNTDPSWKTGGPKARRLSNEAVHRFLHSLRMARAVVFRDPAQTAFRPDWQVMLEIREGTPVEFSLSGGADCLVKASLQPHLLVMEKGFCAMFSDSALDRLYAKMPDQPARDSGKAP